MSGLGSKGEFLKNLHVSWRYNESINKGTFAADSYRRMRSFVIAVLYSLSPVFLARCRFLMSYGRWPDLENPQSFDEKLLWLMLYWRHPLKTLCGDKYTARSYVEECGLGHLLTDSMGVYESSKDIDFSALPSNTRL